MTESREILRGICLAIMDRGVLKLIGDEEIVRCAALQSQVSIASDDRDANILSTG